MKPNTNPLTGVAFGYVCANDLDPDIVEVLMHGPKAHDSSYEDALEQALNGVAKALNLNCKWDLPESVKEELADIFQANYEPVEEPHVYGMHQGVTYCSSWLGGALNFFIFESPVRAQGRRSSPCVPNAGILTPANDGDVECCGVPADWWAEVHQEA